MFEFKQEMTITPNMDVNGSEPVDIISLSEAESEEEISESLNQNNGDNSKRFYCDTCNASFTMIGNLNRHKKSHLHHRPYTCNFCLRGFLRRTSYVEHVRLHTGEKPYKCTNCSQSFVRKKCHQMHMRKCTGLSCPVSPESNLSHAASEPANSPTLPSSQPLKRTLSDSMKASDPSWKFNPLHPFFAQPSKQLLMRSPSLDSTSSQSPADFNANVLQQLQNPFAMASSNFINKLPFPRPPRFNSLPLFSGLLPFPDRNLTLDPFSGGRPIKPITNQEPTLKVGADQNSIPKRTPSQNIPPLSINSILSDKKLWPCKVCDIYFADQYLYLSHVSMHGEENSLICNLCKKTCKSVHEFLMHH